MQISSDAHSRYLSLVDELEQTRYRLEEALGEIAENEMRWLAQRFPKRRIEFHSGMGTTQITIGFRNSTECSAYNGWNYYGEEGTSSRDWPPSVAIPAPNLWAAIRLYQEEVSDRGNDPGIGSIIYENGHKLKGLGCA